MSTAEQELLSAFDGHDVQSVRAALDAGADPCTPIRGKLPVSWLLEEYTRSDRLANCLRLLFERGAVLDDPAVAPVLLNDVDALRAAVRAGPCWPLLFRLKGGGGGILSRSMSAFCEIS
jgi:hypothetical protein